MITYNTKNKKCGRTTSKCHHFRCQEVGVPMDTFIKTTSAGNVSSILHLVVSELQHLFLSVHSPLYHLPPDGRAHLGKRRHTASFKSPSRRNSMAKSTYGAPGRSPNMRYHSELPKADGGQGCFPFILWLLLSQDLPRFLLFGFGFYPVCYTFNL